MTATFPSALYLWEMADPMKVKLRTGLRLGGLLGFVGGFYFAYQRSSLRFWGWTENTREEAMDRAEMGDRISRGLPLYGHSDQPEWVQGAAYRNSAFSQLKMHIFPMFNLVEHQHHGKTEADYKEAP